MCLTIGAWRMQEMAKSRPVELKGARSFKSLVLHETDRLSKEAQHSLRRTMEKYTAACRLVLICNNVSKVGAPTSSACCGSGAHHSAECRAAACLCAASAVRWLWSSSLRHGTRQGCLLPCAHGPPEWGQKSEGAHHENTLPLSGCWLKKDSAARHVRLSGSPSAI